MEPLRKKRSIGRWVDMKLCKSVPVRRTSYLSVPIPDAIELNVVVDSSDTGLGFRDDPIELVSEPIPPYR